MSDNEEYYDAEAEFGYPDNHLEKESVLSLNRRNTVEEGMTPPLVVCSQLSPQQKGGERKKRFLRAAGKRKVAGREPLGLCLHRATRPTNGSALSIITPHGGVADPDDSRAVTAISSAKLRRGFRELATHPLSARIVCCTEERSGILSDDDCLRRIICRFRNFDKNAFSGNVAEIACDMEDKNSERGARGLFRNLFGFGSNSRKSAEQEASNLNGDGVSLKTKLTASEPGTNIKLVKVHSSSHTKSSASFEKLVMAQELVTTASVDKGGSISTPSSSSTYASPTDNDQDRGCSGRMSVASSVRQPPPSPAASPIWTLKFSGDGRYLASGGKDAVLRIWCLVTEDSVEPTAETDTDSYHTYVHAPTEQRKHPGGPFRSRPLREYHGHARDILDLSWSKNDFVLSSSMDKTVRLWHPTREDCLCCFQHDDFVASIAFQPKDDRCFLSGSLDGKLRLWNISEKKVAASADAREFGLITAVAFTNDGQVAAVGCHSGYCVFYDTDQLRYTTHIAIHESAASGRREASGSKITGIEPMPAPATTPATSAAGSAEGSLNSEDAPKEERLLISSNDSRLRLYNVHTRAFERTYFGLVNNNGQIRASFSGDGKHIVCGSENKHVYLWAAKRMGEDGSRVPVRRQSLFRRSTLRQQEYERFRAHSHVVTAAVFAPDSLSQRLNTVNITAQNDPADTVVHPPKYTSLVIVSADSAGIIRIFRQLDTSTVSADPISRSRLPLSPI